MPKTKTDPRLEPHIIEMPGETMAVVRSHGDPNVAGAGVMKALFGAVYTLKFARKKEGADFKVTALRARWPDAHLVPKDQWTGIWALPLPEGTAGVPQKEPGVTVAVERWDYGTVAQILHLGPYSEEPATIARLHEFIAANGYEIAGSHEEEYLTRPDVAVPKTLIRYPVRRK